MRFSLDTQNVKEPFEVEREGVRKSDFFSSLQQRQLQKSAVVLGCSSIGFEQVGMQCEVRSQALEFYT